MKVHSWLCGSVLLLLLTLAGAEVGYGHARFSAGKLLKPRSNADNNKVGPCGPAAKLPDDQRVELTAGADILVEWEETIEHPGWYRLAYSVDGEAGFDSHVILDDILDQTGMVSQGNPLTWHRYSSTITVPDIVCEKCAIQLIQVMNENPTNPKNYYSCADVRIVKEGSTAKKPVVPVIKSVTPTKTDSGAIK